MATTKIAKKHASKITKPTEAPDTAESKSSDEIVTAAFGQRNRVRLLNEYFASQPATSAWTHVYRLLLWTDQTTGLAHCYESDKTQPGKPWYARTLAFHGWLAGALNAAPNKISEKIDWMFQKAAGELAAEVVYKSKALLAAASRQRKPFEGKGFPSPGEDPKLVAIVKQVLGEHLTEPSPEKWRELVQRIRQYLTLDNKRKNLLGEGFEDVLGSLIVRSCPQTAKVHIRRPLPELPGFNPLSGSGKPNRVDLAIIRPNRTRTLVTAKWSVRADREKQFVVDYGDYIKANSNGKAFEYVFVTNEFDPARLMRACDNLAGNSQMFTHVVHVNTDALRATYGTGQEESMRKVLGFIDSGRLISLDQWLHLLAN